MLAEHVKALIAWLDATAEWLRADHAAARAHGRSVSTHDAENLRLYEGSSLMFREAYGLIPPEW